MGIRWVCLSLIEKGDSFSGFVKQLFLGEVERKKQFVSGLSATYPRFLDWVVKPHLKVVDFLLEDFISLNFPAYFFVGVHGC